MGASVIVAAVGFMIFQGIQSTGKYFLTPSQLVSQTEKDPRYFNWVDALSRLQHTNTQATVARLVASLRVGQQLLFVRPLTEGAKNWEAPWTQLVRRRAAQWGALLSADRALQPVAVAPHNYRGSSTVGDSAVLYRKIA